MKSLEKLREWSKWLDCTYATDDGKSYTVYSYKPYENMKSCGEYMRDVCDEIEREISERYMLKSDAEIDKTAVQEYNLAVQVVAEPKIEYTAELRHRCGATTSISVAFRLE